MKIQLKGNLRIQLIILQLVLLVLMPMWMLKLSHFFYFPISSFFSSQSLIPHRAEGDIKFWKNVNLLKTIFNICLFGLFFAQHITMASLKFKVFMAKLWKNFPIFQRLIFNVVSSLLLMLVLQFQRPQNYVIFTLPIYLTFPLFIIGIGMFIQANSRMEQNIFFPYGFQKLATEKSIQVQQINEQKILSQGITMKGSYSLIRHPMQCGVLLFNTFGNTIFTSEKLIILAFFVVCISIGVLMEEKRLLKKFKQYESYLKAVKSRFIPFVI